MNFKEELNFMKRCKWCNLNNEKYIEYHDHEWCKSNYNDKYLFEMLILESFQAGLSWECVLNKREDFKKAFDNFDIDKICHYEEYKMKELFPAEKASRLSAENMKLIEEIAERTIFITEHVEAMVEARKVANKIESEREKAIAYHDTIAPMLEEIRYHIDKLELIVDNQMWTLPKYRELLFIR